MSDFARAGYLADGRRDVNDLYPHLLKLYFRDRDPQDLPMREGEFVSSDDEDE